MHFLCTGSANTGCWARSVSEARSHLRAVSIFRNPDTSAISFLGVSFLRYCIPYAYPVIVAAYQAVSRLGH